MTRASIVFWHSLQCRSLPLRSSRHAVRSRTARSSQHSAQQQVASAQPQTSSAPQPAQPAAPAPAAAQLQPAPRPPFPNRANSVMPSWLRVRGEFRERVEGFENCGFIDERDDCYCAQPRSASTRRSRRASAWRSRPGAGRARRARRRSGRPARRSAARSICAWRSPTSATRKAPVACALGRQELAFGEQRLVGHLQLAEHRAHVRRARASPSARRRSRSTSSARRSCASSHDEFDKSGNGNRFAGAYATSTKLIPQATVEPYVFWRRDVNLRSEARRARRRSQQTTIGVRVAGKLPARLDYSVEMALQRGSLGADDDQRLGRPLAAARVAARRGRRQADRRIQLRLRRRRSDRRHARHVRSAVSHRRTTSTAWPIRSAGGTSTTCAPASRSRRSRRRRSRSTITRGGSPRQRDALYARERRAARARRRRRRRSARRPGARRPGRRGRSRRSCSSRPATRTSSPARSSKQATPGASYSHPYVMVTYVFLAEKMTMTTKNDVDDARSSRPPAPSAAACCSPGLPAGWVGGVYADDSPGDDDDALRHHRADRLRADRHGARARLLQEVRHRVDRLEGSVVGGHPRQAVRSARTRRRTC